MSQGVCAFVAVDLRLALPAGVHRAGYIILAGLLSTNHYSLNVFLITNATQLRVVRHDILTFETNELSREHDYQGVIIRMVCPTIPCEVTTLSPQPFSKS